MREAVAFAVMVASLGTGCLGLGQDEPRKLVGHEDEVGTLAFAPSGTTLASGSMDKTIRLWDAATGKDLMTLRGHTSLVYCVSFRPDGMRLVSTSVDMTCRIWDVETGKELRACGRSPASTGRRGDDSILCD